jgi:hypothetical protein
LANREKDALQRANRQSDELTATQLQRNYFPLDQKLDMQDSTIIPFLGVEYEITRSDISGGEWIHYGEMPVTYHIPFFKNVVTSDSTRVPYAYLVPQEWMLQIERLKLHGIQVDHLAEEIKLTVSSYRFKNVSWLQQPFEGRHLANFETESIEEERHYPPGTAVILMNQRTNRVAIHILEPRAPDSFVKWGFWNTIFERKEYAEDYVLEKMAREMMAENPQLEREYEETFANDSTFGKDHWSRLYFFYAHTPYWEKDVNVYPVGKLMEPRQLPLKED